MNNQPAHPINSFSVFLGAFLVIEGIWGLFSNVVFVILTTNTTHAIIHIILGVTGIILGLKQNAKNFSIFLALLIIIVGILRFVPGPDELMIKILNVNEAVAYLNIIVGVVLLSVALFGKSKAA